MISLIAAFQFLTIFPTIIRRMFTSQEMGRAVGWFPLVGVVLGFALYGVNYAVQSIFPANVSAALTLAAWIILTRAFHLDGFMDTCDGLFGGFTPERRLEIMKDSRVGAFGVAGGVLILLTKYVALASMTASTMPLTCACDTGAGSAKMLPALVISTTLGRLGMVFAIFAFPYARENGLGREVKDNVRWEQIVLATCIASITVWLAGAWMGLLALALAGISLWLGARYILRLIPGLTGDSYGALCEGIELVILLMFTVRGVV